MRLEPLIKVWKASSCPLIVNPNGNKPNALATFFFAGLYCLYQKPSISYVSWPEKFLSKTPFSYLLMILDLSSVFMGKKYNANVQRPVWSATENRSGGGPQGRNELQLLVVPLLIRMVYEVKPIVEASFNQNKRNNQNGKRKKRKP